MRCSVRWRKRWVNSTYRRDVKQSLAETTDDFDRLTDRTKAIERHPWRKCADLPLGKKLLRDKTWEIGKLLRETANTDRDYLAKLAKYLCDLDLTSGRVVIIIRQVRSMTIEPHSVTLDLTWEDLIILEDYLIQLTFCHDKT